MKQPMDEKLKDYFNVIQSCEITIEVTFQLDANLQSNSTVLTDLVAKFYPFICIFEVDTQDSGSDKSSVESANEELSEISDSEPEQAKK